MLRPHLHQAYLDAERRRHPVPQLTARHWDLLRLVAAGHTNAQIARRLGISEGTVRIHLENIYDRLNVEPLRRRHSLFPDGVPLQQHDFACGCAAGTLKTCAVAASSDIGRRRRQAPSVIVTGICSNSVRDDRIRVGRYWNLDQLVPVHAAATMWRC